MDAKEFWNNKYGGNVSKNDAVTHTEYDDVFETMNEYAESKFNNVVLGNVSDSVLNEVENLMQRWHLDRDNDNETLDNINKLLVKNGRLQWENSEYNQLDRDIIEVVKSIFNNGTFVIETINESVLYELMNTRGTPITPVKILRDTKEDYKYWLRENIKNRLGINKK